MKIAVLSGKGGTGKTLISVNLAASAKEALYIDCDVEEPNGHLFFKPDIFARETVAVRVPVVDENVCNGCRQCVDFCKYNALAYINKLCVFEPVCHSCGGCVLFCPVNALTEKEKSIGEIQIGVSENVTVLTGILNTGEASGIPIIKKLMTCIPMDQKTTLIDCPPGSACIVMDSIRDADYCILVAEPTLFGLHNFIMVCQLVKLFGKPYGVVLNKCLRNENPVERYCVEKGIRILDRIPYDTELGEMNSNALISVRESGKYRDQFTSLLQTVTKEVYNETAVNS